MPRPERRRINRDKVRQSAKERTANTGGLDTLVLPEGVDFLKTQKGKMTIDVLPYEVTVNNHPQVKAGDLWYSRRFWIHRNVGPEEKSVLCLQKTFGSPCPICEELARMKKDPDANEEAVKSLLPKEREIFNVINLDHGKGEIQILEMSPYCFGQMLEQEIDAQMESDPEVAGFADLEGGRSLVIRFTEESGGGYTFLNAARIDFVERKKDYPEAVLENVVDLDKALKVPSYEQVEALFNGRPVENKKSRPEPEEEEQTTPRKVKPNPEPDPEEEEQEEDKNGPQKCTACEGTGKNSRGKTCFICNGTGIAEEEKKTEEEGQEEKPAAATSSRRKPPAEEPAEEPADEPAEEEKPKAGKTGKATDSKKKDDWDDF